MTQKFAGRGILITGASRGIGRATALALARQGADVAVNYWAADDAQRVEAAEVVAEIESLGRRALLLEADVSDRPAVDEIVARTAETFGRLDHFVACACFSDRRRMLAAEMEGFRRTIDVTMWGAFHGLRAAAAQMVAQGDGGSIVIVSSPRAFMPHPGSMAYNMAKAAVDQMIRTAATELTGARIRVNGIHPGWIDTPGERKFLSEAALKRHAAELPWGRLGTPDEIARAIQFLLSDDADYMTGSFLKVDGGITLPMWAKTWR
jgi:glucose 1-dehydrogenase